MSIYYILGAALGGGLRFWFESFSQQFITAKYPIGTLAANWIGSGILGFILGLPVAALDPDLFGLIAAFTGAFTTFGGFIAQSYSMAKLSKTQAAVYLAITVLGSIAAFSLGFY